jgi:hypothetical protein
MQLASIEPLALPSLRSYRAASSARTAIVLVQTYGQQGHATSNSLAARVARRRRQCRAGQSFPRSCVAGDCGQPSRPTVSRQNKLRAAVSRSRRSRATLRACASQPPPRSTKASFFSADGSSALHCSGSDGFEAARYVHAQSAALGARAKADMSLRFCAWSGAQFAVPKPLKSASKILRGHVART